MPTFPVVCDERYPNYDLVEASDWHDEVVELTEEEAKAFVASKVLYNYWQNIVGKRSRAIKHDL
jgi:hypothetical protein